VVLNAQASPVDRPLQSYSDGGAVNLDEFEERIIDGLAKGQQKSPVQSESPQGTGEGDDGLEIDLEPATDGAAPNSVDETKAETTPKKNEQKKGQMEFITFTDPKGDARRVDVPSVEVKRARDDDGLFSGDHSVSADLGDTVFVAVTTVCSAAAVFGLVAAGFLWYRVHKQNEAARESTYPQYGGTGPAIEKKGGKKSPTASGDASLAYSAQLHHFNQTKQKILSAEQTTMEQRGQESDDSEGEGEEVDFSVYECPGLAPTGDIEVSNPMFDNSSPKSKEAPRDGE
jgi:hypothetical protein